MERLGVHAVCPRHPGAPAGAFELRSLVPLPLPPWKQGPPHTRRRLQTRVFGGDTIERGRGEEHTAHNHNHTHTYTQIYIYIYMYNLYIYICISTYLCMYVCMHGCMYVYTYIHTYIHAYIHTNVQLPSSAQTPGRDPDPSFAIWAPPHVASTASRTLSDACRWF